jgi:hypothetical protein
MILALTGQLRGPGYGTAEQYHSVLGESHGLAKDL